MRAVAHFHIKHLSYNEWTYQIDADHGGACIDLQGFYWDAGVLSDLAKHTAIKAA